MTPIAWLKGLTAAIIGGAATAISSIGGAAVFGQPLNYTQISAVGISAAFFSACAFLAKSPIPDDVTVKSISFEPNKVEIKTTTDKNS